MILKQYQQQALEHLEKFFSRCKTTNSPAQAFRETTAEWFGSGLSYRPLHTLPEVPYVCLRIPTGGGKTLVGGMAIERANRSLLFTQHSVTLWLVPSEPIREQTLKALKDPSNLLHGEVFSSLGDVTVLDIDEALRVQPAVLNGSSVIIVATMQAFKRADMDQLNVYKQSGALMPHFENVGQESKGNHSFVDVLRMRHPFIIVDEAHNQGSPLAFETLARFEPSAILELTATPDRIYSPSNGLYSVSAASLQAEEMIKMPLELIRRDNWEDALRDAIGRLNNLQAKAEAERAATGEYIRPVMLLQAERHDQAVATITPETVKKSLIDDFHIPAEQIAIATGTVDELGAENILSEKSAKRFIITIDKLREGWDCPFAYVLCTFRNTNSATAAEQILGRIMRMPKAKRKQHAELNMAYAFVTSGNLQTTVESLKDGLVRNGFEQQEAADFIQAPEEPAAMALFTAQPVTFATPELPPVEAIPDSLRSKIEVASETGSITIKGHLSKPQEAAFEKMFITEKGKEAAHKAINRLHSGPEAKEPSPAEKKEIFSIPVLAYKSAGIWTEFDDTHLLEKEWKLVDYPHELSETDFKGSGQAADGGKFAVSEKGKVEFEYFNRIEAELGLFEGFNTWTHVELVSWLEKNIVDMTLLPDDKAAFLNKAVSSLITDRGIPLAELVHAKFRLRAALENQIKKNKAEAMRKAHQLLLGTAENFAAAPGNAIIFQEGKYAYNLPYTGFVKLTKHFFPEIGDLKEGGEEFECALFLSQLDEVKYWVRNVERKLSSFSLQTSTDRFYPDFICQLKDERILVVEFKGVNIWDTPDSREKRQIGELWANRSNKKCLFVMPKGQDWDAIRKVIMPVK
jgi:type III restriction enzyme